MALKQTQSVYRKEKIDLDNFFMEDLFLSWYASYHKRNEATCETFTKKNTNQQGCDILMGIMASKRFSFGIDNDRTPILGIAHDDIEAVMSLSWNNVAFVKDFKKKTWISLSVKDIRKENSRSNNPVPLRLWLPISEGLFDAFMFIENKPTQIKIIGTFIKAGKPISKEEPPLEILPLTFAGNWKKPES
jgi:hypothetical protein